MNFDDRMAVKMFALVQGGDTVWTSKWAPTYCLHLHKVLASSQLKTTMVI
jgi:hypothetical protein